MTGMPIAYLELPSQNVEASKHFYGTVFGWTFQNYGPDYASFTDSGLDGGFNASNEGQTKAPLPILKTDDLNSAFAAVTAAGGTVTAPIFAFPGGRRFHFTDPAGNELALMQTD